MVQDVLTPFVKEGYITLILDKYHADFQIASSVAEKIREQYRDNLDEEETSANGMGDPVRAIDAANIQVRIPENYRSDPVLFLADILDTKIYDSDPEARVTINPRAGSIVISGDVTIGDVIVSHKNVSVSVEAEGAPPIAQFARIDTSEVDLPRLDRLVQQLGDLKVPTNDVIEIIRGIDRTGKLHGRLIIE
jgi:flagellar P-ring protein precursor FlgI